MKFRPIMVMTAALLSFSAVQVDAADKQGAANVQLVKDFLKDVRVAAGSRDPAKVRAVAERYIDVDYLQHAKGMEPGREGYIKGMSSPPTGGPPGGAPPGAAPSGPPPAGAPAGGPPNGPPPGGAMPAWPKDLYFIGDGEFVVWVSEGMQPGKLVFNMVRVVNGKLKEHWDSF